MLVDRTMIRNKTESTAARRIAYEPPHFERHDLRVITLGGTPGEGDSGADLTENPFAGSSPGDKSFEEDWDNDI